jgi:hypothetical protein
MRFSSSSQRAVAIRDQLVVSGWVSCFTSAVVARVSKVLGGGVRTGWAAAGWDVRIDLEWDERRSDMCLDEALDLRTLRRRGSLPLKLPWRSRTVK